ncbi:MAG: hypothetical protein V4719_04785 [Planctomycetota bacterium]
MACCAPTDVRRLSLWAITFLVVLRLSIGWQFLYEGLWKQHAAHGTEPWTAAGYLKNAKGPFRSTFRNMVDDPYDFDKLDAAKVQLRWQKWKQLFEAHYPTLDAKQKNQLAKLVSDSSTKLKETLSNPEWVGEVREKFKGTIDYKTTGEIELYKAMVTKYEARLKQVQLDFQQNHLDKLWSDLEAKRKQLTGPVDALTAELQLSATKLLNLEQIRRGPSPQPPSKIDSVNSQTIWMLTILGFCLIVGLFSRTAAIGAAGMLLMFYLVLPPWPGVPEAPGPEHSLIVNKNFIEIVACLALACMPSGRWFGLDALIHRFILRGKTD